MLNAYWGSPALSPTSSPQQNRSVGYPPVTHRSPNADHITEQVHNILFHREDDHTIKWEFLTTKAPFPVSKLVADKSIVELLPTTEPGPKVDYDGLRTNLTFLTPYVIKTFSGLALLKFFKSLLQLKAGWLLAAAKLEAFRSYERTLFTYYIEWQEVFQQDTAARPLNELEMIYHEECQEHSRTRASGSFIQQEQLLSKEVEKEAIQLITCKTSREMRNYSRVLWAITEQYKRYMETKKAAAKQENVRRHKMKKKAEEMLQRRPEVKKKNEETWQRQMGRLQQDANNSFVQQD